MSEVKVGPSEDSSGVDLRLTEGRNIRGRVLDAQDRGVRGAVVTCFIDSMTPVGLLSGVDFKQATSGGQGEYEILHLGGECYGLRVVKGGLLPATARVCDWEIEGTSADDVDFYLRDVSADDPIVLHPLAVIAGRVRGPDPVNLPCLRVTAFARNRHVQAAVVRGHGGMFEMSVPGGR